MPNLYHSSKAKDFHGVLDAIKANRSSNPLNRHRNVKVEASNNNVREGGKLKLKLGGQSHDFKNKMPPSLFDRKGVR